MNRRNFFGSVLAAIGASVLDKSIGPIAKPINPIKQAVKVKSPLIYTGSLYIPTIVSYNPDTFQIWEAVKPYRNIKLE